MALENLERKAFARFFSDGLFDIEIGVLLMMIAFTPYLEYLGMNSLLAMMLFLIPVMTFVCYGKIFITSKRLGKVSLGIGRLKKVLKVHLIILTGVLTTYVIFYLGTTQADIAGDWVIVKYGKSVMISLLVITIFAALGYYFETPRFAIYGLVFAAGEFIAHTFNYADNHMVGPVAYGMSGIIIFICGLWIFSKFLKKYPAVKRSETLG